VYISYMALGDILWECSINIYKLFYNSQMTALRAALRAALTAVLTAFIWLSSRVNIFCFVLLLIAPVNAQDLYLTGHVLFPLYSNNISHCNYRVQGICFIFILSCIAYWFSLTIPWVSTLRLSCLSLGIWRVLFICVG
jgi:hypothetical protein